MNRPDKTTGAPDPFALARQKLFPQLRNRALVKATDALAENRAEIAEALVSEFLNKHPADPSALNLLADIARRAKRFQEAEELLDRCTKVSDCAGYRFNYAVILRRRDKFEAGLSLLDELLVEDPHNPLYRDQKAKILILMGRHDEALIHHRHLSEDYPEVSQVWLNYGDALKVAGHLDECIAAYRKALDLAPTQRSAYPRLVEVKNYRFTAKDVEWMEAQLAISALSADDRANLCFALGQAYGDQQLYAKSFESYAKANALRRLSVEADPERLNAHLLNCQSMFTETFFRDRIGWGCASDAPIFIVGLPRSGSTLLEQILSCHTAIEGLGELADLDQTITKFLPSTVKQGRASSSYVKASQSLTDGDCRLIGEYYLQSTGQRRKLGRARFTDKTLTNFGHVGLIHLVLPNAKIIDTRRNPLDCGWSCFKSHFPKGQSFSYKLSDIGRHYVDYVRLMAHFDRVLPGKIHRVIYEALIADPEAEIMRLFEYLELPFEKQCLQFHENRRPVRTLSMDQVRKPLYTSGIGQWRPYEPWLGHLKTTLGAVLEKYPNVPD